MSRRTARAPSSATPSSSRRSPRCSAAHRPPRLLRHRLGQVELRPSLVRVRRRGPDQDGAHARARRHPAHGALQRPQSGHRLRFEPVLRDHQAAAVAAQRYPAPRRRELVRRRRHQRARRRSRKRRRRSRRPTVAAQCCSRYRRAATAALDAATTSARRASRLDIPNTTSPTPRSRCTSGAGAFRYRRTVAVDRRRPRPCRGRCSVKRTNARASEVVDAAPVVFMFPGQGSQYPGMARESVRDRSRRAQSTIDHCCDVLRPDLGLDLRDVLFPTARAPRHRRRRVCATPPWRSRRCSSWSTRSPSSGGPGASEPAAMIGHSVGEFVAATLAGRHARSTTRCGSWRERGRLISSLPAGIMLVGDGSARRSRRPPRRRGLRWRR